MRKYKIFSSKSWMESNAIEQMEKLSYMDDIISISGMPDMHVGKYGPNGCSILSESLQPCFAGSDIGCGLGLWSLDSNMKLDKIEQKLMNFEELSEGSKGTIGGGNHFLEIQQVDTVINEEIFSFLGLSKKMFYIFVHSGSRGIGTNILSEYISEYNNAPLNNPDAIEKYMKQHDYAMTWAKENREICAENVGHLLKGNIENIFDVPHNFVEKTENGYLHRKGSSASNRGVVMIPGSRGDYSVLVRPIPKQDALFSIAHGAGRKITRTDAKYKVTPQKNKMGNRVICNNKNLILEEDPSCYKSISNIISDLEDFGLIEVIAWFKPVITYKTYSINNRKEIQKNRDIERRMARQNKRR